MLVKNIFAIVAAFIVLTGFVKDLCAQPKATELTFTSTGPAISGLGRGQKVWIEKCEKESNGKLKIVPYWSNSLLAPKEIFRGAIDGLADLCTWFPAIELGIMPLNSVMWLPMMVWPSEQAQASIYAQLLEKYPQMKKEYGGLMLYGISSITPGQINTVDKAVRVPSDLKGMRITPATVEVAKMVMKAGGAPIDLVVSDWYSSLERGVTEGIINALGPMMAFRCVELLDYHTLAIPGGWFQQPHVLLISPDNWKKIPPDIQKVLRDNEKFYSESCIRGLKGEEKAALGFAEKKGNTIITLTPEEHNEWQELARPIHAAWVEKNADKGAKEIYADLQRLISEYEVK